MNKSTWTWPWLHHAEKKAQMTWWPLKCFLILLVIWDNHELLGVKKIDFPLCKIILKNLLFSLSLFFHMVGAPLPKCCKFECLNAAAIVTSHYESKVLSPCTAYRHGRLVSDEEEILMVWFILFEARAPNTVGLPFFCIMLRIPQLAQTCIQQHVHVQHVHLQHCTHVNTPKKACMLIYH